MTNPKEESEESLLVPKKGPRRKLILVMLLLSTLSTWCCGSLVPPFFPLEASNKGVSETVIGDIVSCSEFVIFLLSPVIGSLISRTGPRFFFIAGLCLFGCCDAMFGCLNLSTPGLPYTAMCFAVRMVEAVGTSSVRTAGFVVAGNTFPDRIITVFGMMETAGGIGTVIGPITGGLLNQYGGYSLPVWVFGSCVFVCGCISWIVIPQQERLERNKNDLSTVSLFRSPLVWFGSNCMVACMIGFTVWFPVLSQHLAQFDMSQTDIGVVFAVSSVSYSLLAPFWGYMLDRKVPIIPVLVGGLFCTAVNMLFFGPAPFLTFLPTSFLGPVLGGTLVEYVGFGWTMAISSLPLIQPVICFSPLLASILYEHMKPRVKTDYFLL